jgi:hypothetical protein
MPGSQQASNGQSPVEEAICRELQTLLKRSMAEKPQLEF